MVSKDRIEVIDRIAMNLTLVLFRPYQRRFLQFKGYFLVSFKFNGTIPIFSGYGAIDAFAAG